MNVARYELASDASVLDRSTLRLMKWWHRSGRDLVRAATTTALIVSAVLGAFLVATPGDPLVTTGTGLAMIAGPAGWLVYRRIRPFTGFAVNKRARATGIAVGVVVSVALAPLFVLPLLAIHMIVISASNVGSLLAYLPAGLLAAVGAGAARWRRIRYENPIYP